MSELGLGLCYKVTVINDHALPGRGVFVMRYTAYAYLMTVTLHTNVDNLVYTFQPSLLYMPTTM